MPEFISRTNNNVKTISNDVFKDGCIALSNRRLTDAYRCFENCDESDIASNFNLALCFYLSLKYDEALSYISKAQQHCAGSFESVRAVPQCIMDADAASDSYLSPMLKSEITDKKRILRLKADILSKLNKNEELKAIIAQLDRYHFANIELIKKNMEE